MTIRPGLVRSLVLATAIAASLGLSAPAQAIWPVIDGAALVQLVQQVGYWRTQIQQMQLHLGQLRQTATALTGPRGMQALLPTAPQARNYLPASWTDVNALSSGAPGGYAGLSALVAARMQGVTVLPANVLAALTPEQRKLVTDGRNSAALLQALSETAYASTSARFQQLQSLIQAIGVAGDAKAISDLQGRIQAEQAMLENENTKLTVLYQAAQAERWAQEQRLKEQAIVQIGSARNLPRVAY